MSRTKYRFIVRRKGCYDHKVDGFTNKKVATQAMKKYLQEHPTGDLGMKSIGWVEISMVTGSKVKMFVNGKRVKY